MEGITKPQLKGAAFIKRKAVSLEKSGVVKTRPLFDDGALPLLIEPCVDGVNLTGWATANKEFIASHITRHGGLLFHGFGVRTAQEFERFIEAASGELLEYSYGSTPRSKVSGRIYTSTEYPADQLIPLHNEMSYSRQWPMRIFFLCLKTAAEGGETPVADSRRVFQRLSSKTKERFIEKKVLYVRNYGDSLDLDWRQVFQTTDKRAVEDYCRRSGIEYEWKAGERLRTRQLCQSVATHPQTHETVWFNQAHLFHISALDPAMREAFLSEFDESDLPRNAYHGDGSPLDTSMLEEIREAYRQETVLFPWQEGDVMMLDNMLAAHGRTPFRGERKILAGMSQLEVNHNI